MSLAPDVPTDYWIVDIMVDMLNPNENHTIYDLGCGDGRILIVAAEKYKNIKGVGIEERPILVEIAKYSVKESGFEDRISIVEGNVLDNFDMSDADEVTMYLTPGGVNTLKPILERQLKVGCKVLSRDYPIEGWGPVEIKDLPGSITLYLYEMGSQYKQKTRYEGIWVGQRF